MDVDIQEWSISKLKRHPRQEANFHDVPDGELRRLAGDMKQNGQLAPIEILPDGTIIDGHQRFRAANQLEWTTIKARVRHDLKGDKAVERRQLEANLNRRQLHPLDRVRVAIRMAELEKFGKSSSLDPHETRMLIGKLAGEMNMSRRNVRRWVAVATAEMAIQALVQADRLKLVDGEKASRLDRAAQLRIAAEIEGGADPRQVLGEELRAAGSARPVDPSREFGKWLQTLEKGLEFVVPVAREIRRGQDAEHDLEVIERGLQLFKRLAPLLRKQARKFRKDVEELEASLEKIGAAR